MNTTDRESRIANHVPITDHAELAEAPAPIYRRYLCFGWLFKDASRGTRLERAAAWRFNQSQARWLPTYLRRWVACGLLLYGTGGFVEWVLGASVLSAFFYVPGALSVSVDAVIAVAWVGLRTFPAPS